MTRLDHAFAYVLNDGRPLDRARLGYAYHQTTQADVLNALATYQCDDGGFKHLEPDFEASTSTPMDTWMAINILREIDAPSNHPVVDAVLKYIQAAKDADEKGYFHFATSAMQDGDHAPWWHTEVNRVEGFNPTASLVAFYYAHTNPKEALHDERIRAALAHIQREDTLEIHEWRALMEMVLELPELITPSLKTHLTRHLEHHLSHMQGWQTSYQASPIDLFFHPKIVSWAPHPIDVFKHQNDVLEALHEDGFMPIRWQWEGRRFASAKKTWQSITTTQALLWLRQMVDLTL